MFGRRQVSHETKAKKHSVSTMGAMREKQIEAIDIENILIPEVPARRTLRGEEETKIETSDWKRELLPEGEDDEDQDQNNLKKKMMTMMMHHARPEVRVGLRGGLGPMLGLDCQTLMMMHHARPEVRVGLCGGLGPKLGLDCQMLRSTMKTLKTLKKKNERLPEEDNGTRPELQGGGEEMMRMTKR